MTITHDYGRIRPPLEFQHQEKGRERVNRAKPVREPNRHPGPLFDTERQIDIMDVIGRTK